MDRINHKEGFLRQNNMSNDSELSSFSESSNDDKDIDVMDNQYTQYRIAISLSTTLCHQDIVAARIEDRF